MSLKNKVAVITGASNGLGKVLTELLAKIVNLLKSDPSISPTELVIERG